MSDTLPTPEWRRRLVISTLITAAVGIVGFAGKEVYARWKSGRTSQEAELQSLKQLAVLVQESDLIYREQLRQLQRLEQLIEKNHGAGAISADGYDATFYKMYRRMTREERDLQRIIRSVTMTSQRRVNQQMSKWLQTAQEFKTPSQPTEERKRLAAKLQQLELHLNQWHAKYEVWMPDEAHTVVFLDDEQAHSVGFPRELKKSLDDVINAVN